MRNVLLGLVIALAVVFCVMTTNRFNALASTRLEETTICTDRSGSTFASGATDRVGYLRCLQDRADRFLKYDVAASADLSKSFLSLVIAVFVASIAFSEKIVDLRRAGWWSRGVMITCWILLLAAIALAGVGLVLMTFASGWAAHRPELNYWALEYEAMRLFVLGGVSFGSSLVAMFVAGLASLMDRELSHDGRARLHPE
jgi:hypothetical protein